MRRPDPWVARCRDELVSALQTAADLFPHSGEDTPRRIHEARKALKSARALARLFGDSQGFLEAMSAVDSARRRIGAARNLDVMPALVELLSGDIETEAREQLLKAIAFERETARLAHDEIDVVALELELRSLARAIAARDIASIRAADILAALRGQYRGVRKLGKKAFDDVAGGQLHALRTLVVDFGCQLAVFEPAWPALIGAMSKETQKLRQALGDINDLAMLGEFAIGRRDAPLLRMGALALGIERRQRRLGRRAAAIFARVFAERPGAFERRLAAYLANPKTGVRAPAVRDSAP